jgi:predicted O-methyltransferase YrrM
MAAPRLKPHDATEYIQLLQWMRGAKSILEIGSRFGYPLVDFAHCMDGRGKVVSVDLPDAEGWNDKLSREAIVHLRNNIQQLYNEGYDAVLYEGDSKDPGIVNAVRSHGPFDVVFIDGDHSYEGAKYDWMNYGPMGKVVIFHDIKKSERPQDSHIGVWKLWKELNEDDDLDCVAFIADGSPMGIGKVERETASA